MTFISHLFVGSISGRQMVNRSGFLKIEPKDDVMADRGFTIRDLLLRRDATLNMSAFSKGKRKLLVSLERSPAYKSMLEGPWSVSRTTKSCKELFHCS